jgi:hypothetical protein
MKAVLRQEHRQRRCAFQLRRVLSKCKDGCKHVVYQLTPLPSITSAPIKIIVGTPSQDLYVHEGLLRSSSSFFDNALKEEWKEGQQRTVSMSETPVGILKIWVKWLYTGRIFLTTETDSIKLPDSKKSVSYEWPRWANCYALGDFLQDSDFKDAAVDVLVEAIIDCKQFPIHLASYIYPYSPPGSAHRRFAVDIYVNLRVRENLGRDDQHPDEFMLDVVRYISPKLATGIKQQSTREYFDLNDMCRYHDHGSDKPCYKTKPAFRF